MVRRSMRIEEQEQAAEEARQRRALERARRKALLAQEASGEARGYRYAIACSVGWVGPHHRPGPHVHEDSCTHREPIVYEGTRETANARAQQHADGRERGATYHSPMIVPEELIERHARQQGWK